MHMMKNGATSAGAAAEGGGECDAGLRDRTPGGVLRVAASVHLSGTPPH